MSLTRYFARILPGDAPGAWAKGASAAALCLQLGAHFFLQRPQRGRPSARRWGKSRCLHPRRRLPFLVVRLVTALPCLVCATTHPKHRLLPAAAPRGGTEDDPIVVDDGEGASCFSAPARRRHEAALL
jgi:hypothetical protein